MKRSEHLQPLSHDHYAGLQVARRMKSGAEKGADRSEMAAFLVYFWDTYLSEHFRQEEEHLVAALRSSNGAALAERMIEEHRGLERRVDAMRTETPDLAAFDEFASLLNAHIRFEEREAFPHLEENLADEDLLRIGRTLHDEHVDADLTWREAFWE